MQSLIEMPKLFNINGSVGKGAYAAPEYPAVKDFIRHLDYLGIDRSLVWHAMALDFNPTIGNRRLLAEIVEAGEEERLLPAFIITPTCYFEHGSLEFLRESFASGRVRALRMVPGGSRFPIRHLERILRELEQFSPLLFWDTRLSGCSEEQFHDFEYLAKTLPGINFAVTWQTKTVFGSVLDLMWRCPNVYADISTLYVRGAIELLRDEFGAERMLFGIGFKVHYGAAQAALSHAQISGAEKELVAHGNLERLLKLAPLTRSLCGPSSELDKPLWKKFKKGERLDEVEIIDAHGHDGPIPLGWYLRESSFDALVAQMDRLGVNKLFISSIRALFSEAVEGNRHLAEAARPFADRIAAYLSFNPLYANDLTPRLDEFFADPFYIGFKLLAAYWQVPLQDPAYTPVWEYADLHHLPILLHTWSDDYNSPAMLTEIVRRYPNASFILGHSGGATRGRLEAEKLATDNANVYLEFCGSFVSTVPFETSAGKVGWDRVIFGSDTGAHAEAWELGRYLSMPVPDEVLLPGLAANVKKILAKTK
jgi:hypothetical protein